MRSFRPIDQIFIFTLLGLFIVIVSLQYYRPSMEWHQPILSPTQEAANEELNEVLQLAENWKHAQDTMRAKNDEPFIVLPKFELPAPKPKYEPSKPQQNFEQPNRPQPIKRPQEYGNRTQQLQDRNYYILVLSLSVLILIVLRYWYRISFSRQKAELDAAPKVADQLSSPKIAGNFQRSTVSSDWLSAIQSDQRKKLSAERKTGTEQSYKDELLVSGVGAVYQEPEPEVSTLEKVVFPFRRWLNPSYKIGTKYRIRFRWTDFWAFALSFTLEFLFLYLYSTDVWFRYSYIGWVTFQLAYLALTYVFAGLFRISKWIYYIVGVACTLGLLFGLGLYALYQYTLDHPELMSNQPYRWWLIGAGVALIFGFRFLRKIRLPKKITRSIWLRDGSFGNVAVFYLLLYIVLYNLGFYYWLLSPVLVTSLTHMGLWLFSPTPKMSKTKQWIIRPSTVLLLMLLSAVACFLWWLGIRFMYRALIFWFFPMPLLVGPIYLFAFYRLDDFERITKKDNSKKEEKKPVQELVDSTEAEAKELITKTVIPTPKKIKTDWRKAENPDKIGSLNLESMGYNDASTDLNFLFRYRNLKFLYMRNNQLKFVPDEIFWMKALKKLDLGHNRLGHIPAQLDKLGQLAILDLSYNNIKNLPIWLGDLTHLKVLSIKGNPIPKAQISALQKKAPQLQIEN